MQASPAAAVGESGTCRMVRFRCGPYTCLLDARQVVSMLTSGGEAVPLERCLGLPEPAPGAPRRRLELVTVAGTLAVAVSEPVELLEIATDTLHPLPPLVAAGCRLPALRALRVEQGEWALVLSSRYIGEPAAGADL